MPDLDTERLSVAATGPGQWLPPPTAEWKAGVESGRIGVDVETASGLIAATAGTFTSARGRFTESSLDGILDLWLSAPGGLRVGTQHAEGSDDRLTWHLGRGIRPRRSLCHRLDDRGTSCEVPCIRFDLAFDPAARKSPHGDLVEYFGQRMRHDQASLACSLVLSSRHSLACGSDDVPLTDERGDMLPLVWNATRLYGVDLVSRGDATADLFGHGAKVVHLRQKAAQRIEQNRDHQQAIGHRLMHRRTQLRKLFGRPDSGLVNMGVDPSTLREIAAELAKLPQAMLQQVWQTGATLEARRVNGSTRWRNCSTRDKVGLVRGLTGAVFTDRLDLDDSANVTLHEFAHLYDNAVDVPSLSPEWLALWRADLAAGRIPDGNERTDAREWFAEGFASYFDSMITRSRLSQPTREYFQALAERAERCLT